MFTGRWPHELSTNWEEALDGKYPTLAETLSAHGYITVGFVANTNYLGYEFGLDRGFLHYEDYVVSPQEILVSSSLGRFLSTDAAIRRILGYYDNITRQDAAAINDHFLAWLARTDHRPFFAFLNYFDAHEPYLPPSLFAEDSALACRAAIIFLSKTCAEACVRIGSSGRRKKKLRPNWTCTMAPSPTSTINWIGCLASCKNGGLLEEYRHHRHIGSRRAIRRTRALPSRQQPLSTVAPCAADDFISCSVPGGQKVAAPVSLRDLPATVVDLIGLQGRIFSFQATRFCVLGVTELDPVKAGAGPGAFEKSRLHGARSGIRQ